VAFWAPAHGRLATVILHGGDGKSSKNRSFNGTKTFMNTDFDVESLYKQRF
jgi:hypothetical protein